MAGADGGRDGAKLRVTWTGELGVVAVEADGNQHTVPGLLVHYRVAGFNYSGDRGSWCELELHETDTTWTIRAVDVAEHEGGEDRTITDFVSEDRGATWRRVSAPSSIEGEPVDKYDTNALYWRARLSRPGD
jgi:hypothetical protein